jgi:hypothetical protein
MTSNKKTFLAAESESDIFHSYDTRTKVYSLQATAPNYCLQRCASEIKSAKSIIKFKKILSNFLLEKGSYSVKKFMTVDS